jgi:hypothetical protein
MMDRTTTILDGLAAKIAHETAVDLDFGHRECLDQSEA